MSFDTVTNKSEENGKTIPDWKPLYLFNLYRFTVAIVFTSTFVADIAPSFLGHYNPKLFLITSWIYSFFAFFSLFISRRKWIPFSVQVVSEVLIDIFAITLLMHASSGVNSGLGILLVVVIAGGSLLTEGRTAFFFAAVASLCVLIHVTLADIYDWFPTTSYTHASMLGTTFFATALLAYVLAQRARASEALAKQRGIHVEYLAQLNAQIVQHILSGIIVIDVAGQIRLFNEAARRLLGLKESPVGRMLPAVIPQLFEQLTIWQNTGMPTPHQFRPVFRPVSSQAPAAVMASFTELDRAGAVSILIVLEEASLIAERAQQLKLAALGRLTASIAHEIRNPLGAISHAGQLLDESERLSDSDKRLTRIIVEHCQRMNAIVENVLQLSRREQSYMQRFDLHNWIIEFVEEFSGQKNLAADDIVICTLHLPLTVCFDAAQLYQVLSNLCDNGLRYSQGSPLLKITIGKNDSPYLDVLDYGSGMSEEVAAQIFEPFFTTEPKGTGLGLYIAREICEANRATLHVVSNDSNGCCFRIHFTDVEN